MIDFDASLTTARSATPTTTLSRSAVRSDSGWKGMDGLLDIMGLDRVR
jgi:hypothetical protein